MGSNSKKHKKEKKKKHKSRSRSPLEPGAERERKHHHRKHKKRDRSPDVEEVPVDSHLIPTNGYSSKDLAAEEYARDRYMREEAARERSTREEYSSRDRDAYTTEKSSKEDSRGHRESARDKPREDSRKDLSSTRDSYVDKSPPQATNNAESLSIEETNRLRAKLGLKPLQVEEERAEDGKLKDDLGEFYHTPAANLSEQKRTEKLKQKLQERKEKRQLEQRFLTGSLLDDSDDEDASAWVNKNRQITKQREEAAKRAAMLDEMDAVFGVGALVAEEEREERGQRYTPQQLKGLRVAHDTDNLTEGREMVLTLADKNVLDEDNEDVLVNVNMVDDEKYKKNIEDRKKAKSGYQAYDDAADMEAAALGYSKPVLAKYDEEIDKNAAAKARGFVIGDEDGLEAKRFRQMMVKARLAGEAGGKRLESLKLPELTVASDYLSEVELSAKFKKPKRKGKMRKKPKAEPIDVDEYDPNNAPLETDDTDVTMEQLKAEEDPEETEPDSELQVALARARRLRQVQQLHSKIPKVEEIVERVKEEVQADSSEVVGGGEGHMVLDATAEFCRTLGDIPTYGLAGNRDANLEMMDFEREETAPELEEGETTGAWSRVDVGAEKPPDITAGGSSSALEAEPALGAGVGGALRLALSKGYLERQTANTSTRASNTHHLLTAKNYSIEDKTHGEEDKFSRRGQDRYSGPLQDFREKSNFRPNVKLDYVDDDGRPLCPKEAFRYLSHKFHGKGPGKNKQEKRIKKSVQEGLMKKMSSTDTPLGTLAMLQGKQKETQSPYIVLSGTKREPHPEEDKFSRRGQDRYSGPLQDFREKSNFRPNVKLDYVDDDGRPLCPKEAFRYLSHKFHGKGPGKNKQEKRIKKSVQEGLMKKMSSTDTPLGTLAMLQGKQKETQSPYIVLSGTKREPHP